MRPQGAQHAPWQSLLLTHPLDCTLKPKLQLHPAPAAFIYASRAAANADAGNYDTEEVGLPIKYFANAVRYHSAPTWPWKFRDDDGKTAAGERSHSSSLLLCFVSRLNWVTGPRSLWGETLADPQRPPFT